MATRRFSYFPILMLCTPGLVFAGSSKQCVSADAASKMLKKDVCVSAHVYDVVQIEDGTRFLDVCAPEITDDKCMFTVMSLPEDRGTVGELNKYRATDIHLRGIVQPMHGRVGILLSHARQFDGGPPRFKPNPLLAKGFGADQDRRPINDPNLRAQGGRRAFMNTRDKEPLPAK